MSVSLDGFVETPSRSLDWVQVDEGLHAFFNDEARGMSAFLYGRRMYELMSDYWPTAETDPAAPPAMVEFASIWKDKPKVVFSRTLEGSSGTAGSSAMTPRRRSPGSRRSRGSTWTSAVRPPPPP